MQQLGTLTPNVIEGDGEALTPFDLFYSHYQKKADKPLARKRFEALAPDLQQRVILDVMRRNTDHEPWREKKFVPSPAKYLLRELWNDEIIPYQTRDEAQAAVEDGSTLARFYTMLKQFFGKRYEREFGEIPNAAFKRALGNITEVEAARILSALLAEDYDRFRPIPDLHRLCFMRRMTRPETVFAALPAPECDPAVALAALAEMKKFGKRSGL